MACGHRLERQQADGLLLEFFHAGRAVLAGGSEDLDDGRAHRFLGVKAAEEQRQRDGGRVSDDVDGGLDGGFRAGIFDERRAEAGVGAFLGGAREVNHGSAGGAVQQFESFAAGFGGAGQEDGARIDEACGIQAADNGGLVADAGKRSGLFADIGNQPEIEPGGGGRDDVADLAAEQGIGTDESDSIHEGRKRRRMMPPRRMKMPLPT
jgi:hypothetical protein